MRAGVFCQTAKGLGSPEASRDSDLVESDC